ncbi:MAG: hypothetical protein H6807_06515 [Planctomycetes bacterium]|nr:hypothetical protein [Planctomycetota bacterium]
MRIVITACIALLLLSGAGCTDKEPESTPAQAAASKFKHIDEAVLAQPFDPKTMCPDFDALSRNEDWRYEFEKALAFARVVSVTASDSKDGSRKGDVGAARDELEKQLTDLSRRMPTDGYCQPIRDSATYAAWLGITQGIYELIQQHPRWFDEDMDRLLRETKMEEAR